MPGARTHWHRHPLEPDRLRHRGRRPVPAPRRTRRGHPPRRPRPVRGRRGALARRRPEPAHGPRRHQRGRRPTTPSCTGSSRSPTRSTPPPRESGREPGPRHRLAPTGWAAPPQRLAPRLRPRRRGPRPQPRLRRGAPTPARVRRHPRRRGPRRPDQVRGVVDQLDGTGAVRRPLIASLALKAGLVRTSCPRPGRSTCARPTPRCTVPTWGTDNVVISEVHHGHQHPSTHAPVARRRPVGRGVPRHPRRGAGLGGHAAAPPGIPLQPGEELDERPQRARLPQGRLPPLLPVQPARQRLGQHVLGPRDEHRPRPLGRATGRHPVRRQRGGVLRVGRRRHDEQLRLRDGAEPPSRGDVHQRLHGRQRPRRAFRPSRWRTRPTTVRRGPSTRATRSSTSARASSATPRSSGTSPPRSGGWWR